MELYLLEKEAFEVEQAGWRVTAGSRWGALGIENAEYQEYEYEDGEEEWETEQEQEAEEIVDLQHLAALPVSAAGSFWKTGASAVKAMPSAINTSKPVKLAMRKESASRSGSPSSTGTGHSRSSSSDDSNKSSSSGTTYTDVSSTSQPLSIVQQKAAVKNISKPNAPATPTENKKLVSVQQNNAMPSTAAPKAPLWSEIASKSKQVFVSNSENKTNNRGKLLLKAGVKKF